MVCPLNSRPFIAPMAANAWQHHSAKSISYQHKERAGVAGGRKSSGSRCSSTSSGRRSRKAHLEQVDRSIAVALSLYCQTPPETPIREPWVSSFNSTRFHSKV